MERRGDDQRGDQADQQQDALSLMLIKEGLANPEHELLGEEGQNRSQSASQNMNQVAFY